MRFDFHGYTVDPSSGNAEVATEVCRDFAYFVAESGSARPDMSVTIGLEEPVFAGLPDIPASVITPRNVCFRSGDTTFVNYFGRGLAVVNTVTGTCYISAPGRL